MYMLPEISAHEILVYLRKSRTDDPTMSVEETLAKHEQMLDDWAARTLAGAGRVPEGNRYREVVSGETIDSRPQVQELLRRAESPEVKAILIVEPQRLTRGDLEDIGRLVKLLRYSNTIVITLQYIYDLRDERDRDAFERELKRGNEYLEYQKRIMNNGRLLAVENGNYIGCNPPYGYKKIKIKDGKRKCYTLEPDPQTAPILKMIFEWYRAGLGNMKIADKLTKMGIPSPTGGAEWAPHSIPRMLSNQHYIGRVVWNLHPTQRKVVDGKIITTRPKAENYLVYDGKHEPIIDAELWGAVQAKKGKIPRNKQTGRFVNILAGLLFCANCGKTIAWREYPSAQPRLLCPNQRNCMTASAVAWDVVADVARVLREAIEDFEIKLEAGTDDSVEMHARMVAQLEARLAELRDLEVKQWDEKIRGEIPPAIFDRLNGETRREIAETTQALCDLQDATPEPVDLHGRLVTFREALALLTDPGAPNAEKNYLLKACIERIDYKREKFAFVGRAPDGAETPVELDYKLRV